MTRFIFRSLALAAVFETLARVRAFTETAIAPDGRRLAWVEDLPLLSSLDGSRLQRISGRDQK